MRIVLSFIFLLQSCLFAIQTDFDVAVVGTSPISMLEAIYHIHQNKRVLVLEAEERCGGAWKSIDVCGVPHVDLGCHGIGANFRLKEFLENYFGCKFVCTEHPHERAEGNHTRCSHGFYFSGGCYELISKLESAIVSRENALLLHRRLESVYVDSEKGCVELFLGDIHYTTAKLVITPASHFHVQNSSFSNRENPKHNYYHLYLLIEDPTPSRFADMHKAIPGAARVMNLTPFLEMPRTGLQLIVIQTYENNGIASQDKLLEELKQKALLDVNAVIIASETHIYQQSNNNMFPLTQLDAKLVEMLDSSSFLGMARHVERWKGSMVKE